MTELLRWPDDFPDMSHTTDFEVALVALFDQIVALGGSVHFDSDWSLFGFSRETRMIEFVRRGRLRRGFGLCWEVLPYQNDDCQGLGTLFGIRPFACVVISGIDDIRALTEAWLDGSGMESFLGRATFWDKTDTSKPLERVT